MRDDAGDYSHANCPRGECPLIYLAGTSSPDHHWVMKLSQRTRREEGVLYVEPV
jgi:hypothetical protein